MIDYLGVIFECNFSYYKKILIRRCVVLFTQGIEVTICSIEHILVYCVIIWHKKFSDRLFPYYHILLTGYYYYYYYFWAFFSNWLSLSLRMSALDLCHFLRSVANHSRVLKSPILSFSWCFSSLCRSSVFLAGPARPFSVLAMF